MGDFAPGRPTGLRHYNKFNAVVGKLTKGYEAQAGVSPSRLLNKLKRAAPYLGIPRSVVGLLDLLVAYSRSQDWGPGHTPYVWPRNETLSVKLGVSVRQVQNYVRTAIELGLVVPHDSANGHRGGIRGSDGRIVWGYGFDLSPLAARAIEFEAVAAKGEAEDREIDRLRRSISAIRRRVRMLAESVAFHQLGDIDAEHELEIVGMAVVHIRGSRNIDQLIGCVAQLTARVTAFQNAVDLAFHDQTAANQDSGHVSVDDKVAPMGEPNFVHSTTTNQLQPAYAVTSRSLANSGSEAVASRGATSISPVEADLEKHRINPSFVVEACPGLIWDFDPGPRAWGRLVSSAEGLVAQHSISKHAWREACRIMGEKGAAAAVIATVYKTMVGDVRNPGAYLRGMNDKAAVGELNLGRTYHGLRESASILI